MNGYRGSANALELYKIVFSPGRSSTGFCPFLKEVYSQAKGTSHFSEASQPVWFSVLLLQQTSHSPGTASQDRVGKG